MNTYYDNNMLYLPLPNILYDALALSSDNEDDDYPYDENMMEFTPLLHLVGKVDTDSTDSEDEDNDESVIESWAQPESNVQHQSVISFEDIEVQEEDEERKKMEESAPKKLYRPPTQIYSNDNSRLQDCREGENDKAIVNLNPFGYLSDEEPCIVLGQKEQPELENTEKIETSKESKTDIETRKDNIESKVQLDSFSNVEKPKEIEIELPNNKKLELPHKVHVQQSNHSIKVERNNGLPNLKFSFSKHMDSSEEKKQQNAREDKFSEFADYQKLSISTN